MEFFRRLLELFKGSDIKAINNCNNTYVMGISSGICVINGQIVDGYNISIIDGKVYADGKHVSLKTLKTTPIINIKVNASVENITTVSGNVDVSSNVSKVNTKTGNVNVVGDVIGNVITDTGSVIVQGDVQGIIKTSTGDIIAENKNNGTEYNKEVL